MNEKIKDMLISSDQEMVHLGLYLLLNQGEEACSDINILLRMHSIQDFILYTLDDSFYLVVDKPVFFFLKEPKNYMVKNNHWKKVYL